MIIFLKKNILLKMHLSGELKAGTGPVEFIGAPPKAIGLQQKILITEPMI